MNIKSSVLHETLALQRPYVTSPIVQERLPDVIYHVRSQQPDVNRQKSAAANIVAAMATATERQLSLACFLVLFGEAERIKPPSFCLPIIKDVDLKSFLGAV